MMNETIILDEFDQLLSDSQYHFVGKRSATMLPRPPIIYMSATAKVDPDQLEENTLRISVDGVSLDNIQHFICKWISETGQIAPAFAYVREFRVNWLFQQPV